MARNVSLRPAVAGDLDLVAALSAAVGWPHRPADLALMMALGRGHVAREGAGGAPLGVGFWWPYGEAAATLGLIIVAPERQGQGIGRRLMQALLDDAGGRALLLTATEAGRPLYEKLGFRKIGTIRQCQGAYGGTAAAGGAIRAAGPDDLPRLLALDAAAFGAGRGPLLARLLDVGRAVLLEDAGTARGFAVARAFGRGEVVGPLVAASEAEAGALFRAVARPGFVRIDCPAEARRFRAELAEAGLDSVDAPVTMLRGDWPRRAGPLRGFALVSQALG